MLSSYQAQIAQLNNQSADDPPSISPPRGRRRQPFKPVAFGHLAQSSATTPLTGNLADTDDDVSSRMNLLLTRHEPSRALEGKSTIPKTTGWSRMGRSGAGRPGRSRAMDRLSRAHKTTKSTGRYRDLRFRSPLLYGLKSRDVPSLSRFRKRLAKLPRTFTYSAEDLLSYLLPNDDTQAAIDALSDQEIDAILHHCIHRRKGLFAAQFLMTVAENGIHSVPIRRRRFQQVTLRWIFKSLVRRRSWSSRWETHQAVGNDIERSETTGEVEIARNDTPKDDLLDTALRLIYILQDLRHPRSIEIYETLINLCASLERPDVAAGVYVGMVEEWITEGRIAMGVNVDHFHDLGFPPAEQREELELRFDLLKTWWKGIRSWTLPGEVISPHGRLDLWHPRKLALGEKLRRFPLPTPTSPPTLVPPPAEQLLVTIVDSLRLEPKQVSYEEYARSMRACATLSNTILSRTLPFMSKSLLIEALGRTPFMPEVFPEGFDPENVKRGDRWAYSAYTHIHLALQSLNWSVPTALRETPEMIDGNRESSGELYDQGKMDAPYIYAMAPLSLPACRALIKYGLRKLQSFPSTVSLLKYVTETFSGERLKGVISDVFRAAVAQSDSTFMTQVKEMVFATPESRQNDKADSIEDIETAFEGVTAAKDELQLVDALSDMMEEDTATDEQSLNRKLDARQTRFMALARYFVEQDQPQQLEALVYKMIPTLNPTPPESDWDSQHDIDEPHRFIRPRMYKSLIWSLRWTRNTVLCQRVFHEALQADRYWNKQYGHDYRLRPAHRILIHTYTSMMALWRDKFHRYSDKYYWQFKRQAHDPVDGNELGVKLTSRYPDRNLFRQITGFSIPDGIGELPAQRAAMEMIMYMYGLARSAWLDAAWDSHSETFQPSRARGIAPDALFCHVMTSACGPRWGVNVEVGKLGKICDFYGNPSGPLSPLKRKEIENFIKDMEMFDVPIPKILIYRLQTPEEAAENPYFKYTVPKPHTRSYLRTAMKHRWWQGREGRIIRKTTAEARHWKNREVAADLWKWQVEGGGQMSHHGQSKAENAAKAETAFAGGPRSALSAGDHRWDVRPREFTFR